MSQNLAILFNQNLLLTGLGNVSKQNIAWRSRIYTGDPRPPIPPRVMASSAMGLIWGSPGFCWPVTRKQKCKTNAFTIFVHRTAFCTVCLHSQMAVIAGNMYTHLTNYGYFDYGKTPKTPNSAPWQGQKGAGSGISGVYLWWWYINVELSTELWSLHF